MCVKDSVCQGLKGASSKIEMKISNIFYLFVKPRKGYTSSDISTQNYVFFSGKRFELLIFWGTEKLKTMIKFYSNLLSGKLKFSFICVCVGSREREGERERKRMLVCLCLC